MDHFTYQDGVLHAEAVDLRTIAEVVGTPFYCYSSATLERHYRVFAEAVSPLKPMICFAAKANGNVSVLATLGGLGAGADVVSEGEIRLALAAGIPPERIVFSGVGKTRGEMAYALAQGIFQFNVESMPELAALAAVAAERGTIAPVAIRVNPDVDPQTHAKISTGQKESKFGVSFDEARAMLDYSKSEPSLRVQGLSVHIGSQLTSLAPFREAFVRLRHFVEDLRGEGFALEIVDLGGGLGIPYGAGQPMPPSPQDYGAMVVEVMRGLDARFLFEPGRLLVGNAGILISRVLYIKRSKAQTFVIADAAMNDLLRPALYDAYHEIVPVVDEVRPIIVADIVGPVCETGDLFASGRSLPELREGELIAFRSAGAYGASMSSTYNARPLVAEVMVKGKEYAVVRARQSYEDLVAINKKAKWIKY